MPPEETRRPLVTRGSAIAAACLTLGVLGLFLRLQEYGPESALRKFHQAARRGSVTDLQRVTAEDLRRSPTAIALAGRAAAYMRAGGGRFRILRTERTPNQVRAAVAYSVPGGTEFMVWVVERDKRERAWRVSAEGTVRVLRDALDLRP